jgi:hypothetical protein
MWWYGCGARGAEQLFLFVVTAAAGFPEKAIRSAIARLLTGHVATQPRRLGECFDSHKNTPAVGKYQASKITITIQLIFIKIDALNINSDAFYDFDP